MFSNTSFLLSTSTASSVIVTNMTNGSTNSSECLELKLKTFEAAGGALLICLALLILLGNGITLAAYRLYLRKGRFRSNVKFIANMAAADLSMGIILPYVIVLNYAPYLKGWKYSCLVRHVLILFAVNISVLAVALVTIDRYIMFTRPLRHPYVMTRKLSSWLILGSWIYVGVISLIPLVFNTYSCHHQCEIMNDLHKEYFISVLVHSIVLVLIIFGANIHMLRVLVVFARRQRLAHAGRSEHRSSSASVSDHKFIQLLVIVLGFFLVCWLPFFIFTFIGVLEEQASGNSNNVKTVLFFIGVANCTFNPIIYHVRHVDYKMALKKMLAPLCTKLHSLQCCQVKPRQDRCSVATITTLNAEDKNIYSGDLEQDNPAFQLSETETDVYSSQSLGKVVVKDSPERNVQHFGQETVRGEPVPGNINRDNDIAVVAQNGCSWDKDVGFPDSETSRANSTSKNVHL